MNVPMALILDFWDRVDMERVHAPPVTAQVRGNHSDTSLFSMDLLADDPMDLQNLATHVHLRTAIGVGIRPQDAIIRRLAANHLEDLFVPGHA